MKKKQKKSQILGRISASLRSFYSEFGNHFLCPTCLRTLPLEEARHVSEAHIVPRAGGGGLVTYICVRCNSTFGHSQDKWFGEFVRLAHSRSSVLETRHQKGYFSIGGQRVNGTFEVTREGGLEFLIYTDCTPPNAMEEVLRRAATGALDSVTIPLPILENRKLIEFGLVTAAYLLWFRELGYSSWALQRHLDPIRELILHPANAELPKSIGVVCKDRVFESPWIGVGTVAGELCLLTGLANRIVFFPPADCHDLYSRLPSDFSGISLERYQVLRFYDHHKFGGPLGVLYGDRAIVAPDVMLKGSAESRFWFIPPDGGKPRMLYPISKDEFDRKQGLPNVWNIKTKQRLLVPPSETGR
jgi:hypothetical protein